MSGVLEELFGDTGSSPDPLDSNYTNDDERKQCEKIKEECRYDFEKFCKSFLTDQFS